MKTKTWIVLLTVVLIMCLALSAFLLRPQDAVYAEISSQGKVLRTVDLRLDQEFTVTTPEGGSNVVTVRGGKIAVTEANCPDHYCMDRGFCSGGRIVLLLTSDTGFLQLHAAIDELRRALHRTLRLTVSAGISKEHAPDADFHEAYKEAMEALRIAEGESGFCASDAMGSMDQLCGRVLQIIDKEYMDEALTLQSVSDRLHVSASYLGPNIKKSAGDTFINLLIRKRMAVALNLLENSDSRIAEIARRCGYPDQSYFGYCFKKFYGLSPAKMRQERERKGDRA